jgi:1-acyl-sn-glycerol-3-phosphate acyltransferase
MNSIIKGLFYNILIYVVIYCSLPAWGARQLSKFLGIKFEIKGHENIVEDSGCVVLMNHQSALDVLGEFLVCSLSVIVI